MYFSTLSLLSLARLEKFQFQPPEMGRSEIVGVERRSTHLAAHCLPSSCGAASGALPSGGRQRQTFRGRAVGCFSRVEIRTDMPVMVYPFLFISQMRLSRSSAPSTAIHVHVSSIVLDLSFPRANFGRTESPAKQERQSGTPIWWRVCTERILQCQKSGKRLIWRGSWAGSYSALTSSSEKPR